MIDKLVSRFWKPLDFIVLIRGLLALDSGFHNAADNQDSVFSYLGQIFSFIYNCSGLFSNR